MSDRVFLDTNVLVYADDAAAGPKQVRAATILQELIAGSRAVISTQVLQEYFSTAIRKLRLSAEDARTSVEQLTRLEVVLVRPELILGAIDLHRLHKISFWDALIVRCASAAGCARVFTEDLSHGQVIDGVRIENPFLVTAGGKAKERSPTWAITRPAGRASASGSSRRRGSRPARSPRPRG